MILFKKIRYKNLLSTGNTFTEIQLNRSQSTLIVGENGAGKSSILDALSFALYGRPFRKVNKNQLINTINGKGLVVELEFDVGKNEYKIVRGIKPNVFEVYQNGSMVNQNADVKEYQEMLEKNILKLNHKSFSQIVVLGSASFVPFMQLSAAHRRDIIEDLLDIQIFSTMNTLLKEKISANKTQLTEVDYKIRSAADKIELHKKHAETLKETNDEQIRQKEQQIVERTAKIAEHWESVNKLTSKIEALEKTIDDQDQVSRDVAEVKKLRLKLSEKYKQLQKEIAFFEDNEECPMCRQGIHHEHKEPIIAETNESIQQVSSAAASLEKKEDELSARVEAILHTSQKIAKLQKEVSDLHVQIKIVHQLNTAIENEIASLKTNTKHIDDNNDEIQLLKTELKANIANKEELLKNKQVLDIASSLLRDTGIKTKIIKQYIPVINKLINKYLAAMDFFVNFELNENFEETIKSRFRDEFTYDSFSEGEKMRIDLALLFAWRAIAKLRNSASTNLLIMDEVFDGSLDSNGTEEFMKILNGLTQDTNTFIISHKGDQLFDKFHSVIKFEKHKNFSRISQ